MYKLFEEQVLAKKPLKKGEPITDVKQKK
jgi:hypothetical protein